MCFETVEGGSHLGELTATAWSSYLIDVPPHLPLSSGPLLDISAGRGGPEGNLAAGGEGYSFCPAVMTEKDSSRTAGTGVMPGDARVMPMGQDSILQYQGP